MNWLCRELAFGSADYSHALALRESVLRTPLGLFWTAQEVAAEEHSFHLGCFSRGKIVGTLVLVPIDSTTIRMRQVAVADESRGIGVGTALVAFAEDFIGQKGYQTITAHARDTAVPFYRKLGYAVEGNAFVEISIPHFHIFKHLQAGPQL